MPYDADNPAVVRAYAMWCEPMTYRDIGRKMGLSERVVSRMVQAERERRLVDVAAERDAVYAQNVATYERIRDQMLGHFGCGDVEKEARCALAAIKAVNSLDRIHGLDMPTPSVPPPSPLADAIGTLAPRDIMSLVRAFANRDKPLSEKTVVTIDGSLTESRR